jgi:2-oxoglutarate dehydrogenase E1 component
MAVQAPPKVSKKIEEKGPSPANEAIWDAFRRWGYLEASLDPLGTLSPMEVPELRVSGSEAERARAIYCGSIGVEFTHIADPVRRRWIAEQMEAPGPRPDQESILQQLVKAELFEQVLQTRYLGTKRYSLEGLASLIPLLNEVVTGAADHGAKQIVLAMSHRGRLTVMVCTVGKSALDVVTGFEDVDPRSVLGSGDVKYHQGATGQQTTRNGKTVNLHLVSNPSHLEAVDPVAIGRTRAKQARAGENGTDYYVPIEVHGDAAFAGQGIWAETLNMADLPGYTVGGTIHIIGNNLIGFTTQPKDLHSARFSSDLARRQPIPIFHVNAEDPEAVVRVARIALEYRYKFKSDVVVDIIGYRRHGHSEVDDPTITQPLLYKKIKEFPETWKNYAERTGIDAAPMVEALRKEIEDAQVAAQKMTKKPVLAKLPDYWSPYFGGPWRPEYDVRTGIAQSEIESLTKALTSYPSDFHIHPKIKKLLEQREEMGSGKRSLDYGMAEAFAMGSLLKQGVPVRLSGQDTRRGTFNQRHSALVDIENESEYMPLAHVAPDQAGVEIVNSSLSEASVLGFEYGFARDYPDALVMWEAQFGDFANGAQIVIDQFISAGEDKWQLLSGVVMLLPHGYEGQGPEHSSARIERYLQLAAEDNMQICQPSTAAQYFHLLRRQGLMKWRKPLIVFTPKSMLRHPAAASPVAELAAERFQQVIPEREIENATRVLICTGKIGHELRQERARRKDTSTAIVFLEQLYPFPAEELEAEIQRHPHAREIVWVQEEPANMGGQYFIMPKLRHLVGEKRVRSVKRSASASPATGSHKAFEMEQQTLLNLAFANF